MFEYFRDMRTTKSHLRYFDYCGNVLDSWGKTGGQQGEPLEMIVFFVSRFITSGAGPSPSTTRTPAL
jgi:hypothetical protein